MYMKPHMCHLMFLPIPPYQNTSNSNLAGWIHVAIANKQIKAMYMYMHVFLDKGCKQQYMYVLVNKFIINNCIKNMNVIIRIITVYMVP